MKRYIPVMLVMLTANTAFASECVPTMHRTTGTHYEPVTEQKKDIGKGLRVMGQVLVTPDCKPLSNAKVAHWQAGEEGRYINRLRAYLYTDDQGRFEFNTEWPNLTPPHIHFIVTANGHQRLETQWIGGQRKPGIEFTMVLRKSP